MWFDKGLKIEQQILVKNTLHSSKFTHINNSLFLPSQNW